MADLADDKELVIYGPLRLEFDAVCAAIAPAAIAFFDHILTFGQELECIWSRKLTIATIIFALNRYLTLCKMVLLIQIVWASSPTSALIGNRFSCLVGTNWYDAVDCVIQLVIAAFNILRIWALWNQNRRPVLMVLPFALLTPVINIYLAGRLRLLRVVAPFPAPLGGCQIDIGLSMSDWSKFRIVARCSSIITDAQILVLTWLKTFRAYRAAAKVGIRVRVTMLLLRDGTVYFASLFVINAVVLGVTDDLSGISPLSPLSARSIQVIVVRLVWPITLTSVLVSRFILNLRAPVYGDDDNDRGNDEEGGAEGGAVLSARETWRALGNFGGELGHGNSEATEENDCETDIEEGQLGLRVEEVIEAGSAETRG